MKLPSGDQPILLQCDGPHCCHPSAVPLASSVCPPLADSVEKVLFGWRTKSFRAADAFSARRREGPYRFIQNRSRTSVVALKSNAAAEKSKDQLWRDFQGYSIFDFCNNIGTFATCRRTPTMSVDGRRPEVNGRRSKRRFYRFSEVRRWQKCDSPGQCARLFVTGSKSG